MIILKKIRIFLSLKTLTKLLFLEALIFLGWARFLKKLPFYKAALSLGEQMEETLLTSSPSDKEKIKKVSEAIYIMGRHTPWESKCLVRAIAGMKMLERRQIESTLYLGTAKDERGNLIAHAWLRSGSFYITGSEGKERFTVVSKFAKRISDNNIEGEYNG